MPPVTEAWFDGNEIAKMIADILLHGCTVLTARRHAAISAYILALVHYWDTDIRHPGRSVNAQG